MDFAGALGLEEGRFLLRRDSEEATPDVDPDLAPELGKRVLVIERLGAEPRRRRRRRGSRKLPADIPTELDLTRATVVRSDRPLGSPEEAHQWMRSLQRDRKLCDEVMAEAAAAMNRAIHAFALARGDPFISERSPEQAAAIRVGHGLGRELADGRYTEAVGIDLVAKPNRRREAPPGQARVAAILGGRERADACETLILRARADLSAGRTREAAIGLAAAIDAMVVELAGALSSPDHESDMAELAGRRDPARATAQRAAQGPLPANEVESTEERLAICERVLRRRRLLRG